MLANGTRTRQAYNGALTSALQFVLQLAMNATLLPLVLKYAGTEALGTFSILMQASSYLSLVDMGFNVALGRNLAQTWNSNDDKASFWRVFLTGKRFNLLTSSLISVLTLTVGLHSQSMFGLSPLVAGDARTAFCILAVAALIKGTSATYVSALTATQNLAASNLIALGSQAVRTVGSLVLVASGWGVVGLTIANVIADLTTVFANRAYFRHRFGSAPTANRASFDLLMKMLRFGFTYVLCSLGSKLFLTTDLLVVGHLHGAVAAASYYTTQMPAFLLMTLVWRITDNSAPAINDLYARTHFSRIKQVYVDLFRINLVAAGGLSLGLVCFSREIITMWTSAEQYAGARMTLALAVFVVTQIVSHLHAAFLLAAGKISPLAISSFIAGVANVVLSVILGRLMGPEGVMVASVVVDIPLCLFLWRNLVTEYDVSVQSLLSGAVLPAAGVCVPLALLGYFLSSSSSPSGRATILRASLFFLGWAGLTLWIGLPQSLKAQVFRHRRWVTL